MWDIDEPAGQKIVNLISQRYITPSKQPDHPRRSYAYVKGAAAYLWGKAGAGHNLSGPDMGWTAEIAKTSFGAHSYGLRSGKPDLPVRVW